MVKLVTTIADPHFFLRIRTIGDGLHDNPSFAGSSLEHGGIQTKNSTTKNIKRLGALIELKKPIFFLSEIP